MEEKIIIKSKQYNAKKPFVTILILGAILSVIFYVCLASDYAKKYDDWYETYLVHTENGTKECTRAAGTCYQCRNVEEQGKTAYVVGWMFSFGGLLALLMPFAVMAIIGGLIYLWARSYELTVTDKRVYGKTAWGKRVDLPVDSILVISYASFLRGVTVVTSSGRIGFLMIKNAEEIYSSLNELIIITQQRRLRMCLGLPPQISRI